MKKHSPVQSFQTEDRKIFLKSANNGTTTVELRDKRSAKNGKQLAYRREDLSYDLTENYIEVKRRDVIAPDCATYGGLSSLSHKGIWSSDVKD